MPEVTYIHIARDHYDSADSAMRSVQAVEAVAQRGLVGDRYFDASPNGHVTIVSSTELDSAAAELGHAIPPGSTRRNITVSEIQLPRSEGARIRLGDVLVEVFRDCAPCDGMEAAVGVGARQALVRRAGIRGRIVEGGHLRVGDPVEVLTLIHD